MSSEKKEKQFLDMFRLDGKKALVTGGSRGIGKAIALGMAQQGADVIIASRKLPDLEAAAKEIRSETGREITPLQANVRHLEQIEKLAGEAIGIYGRIDILINNAGTNPVSGSVFNITEEIWDIIMGLNLKGYFFLSQMIGKKMRETGGGAIVNVSSQGGLRPGLGRGTYSISKAAVIMLTQVLAQEWGQHNIRVNAIAPGVVKTRLSELLWKDEEASAKFSVNTALGRIAEPEEMVDAVLYLVSDASSYMTGQTLVLDGGYSAAVGDLVKTLE